MLGISNFVLDLLNNNFFMKRTILIFVITSLVIASCIFWYLSGIGTNTTDMVHFGVIFLVVAFAVYFGIMRITSAKRGQPAEDEMSKKVMLKTAATSFYLSLYLWVVMIFVKDRIKMDTEEILGTGILGMAVIFACCWFFFNFRGVKSE